MNSRVKLGRIGAITAALLLGLSGCAANEGGAAESDSGLSGELVGAGASSQGAAQEAWIAGFQNAQTGVTVNYEPSGSGAGRESFQQGGAAFAGSDRAFTLEEIAAGPFEMCSPDSALVEIPAYISPIALILNVEGVDSLNMDADTVASIFTGKISRWNDPQIASQNAGVELPDLAITAVHRSDDSGTTGNFTEYLAAAAPEVWTVGSIETWPTEFGGEGAQGTSGVVEAVSGGVGTIGYADASRAGDLATVSLLVGANYVPYSPEAAAAVVDASSRVDGRADTDMAIELDRTSEADGVYPLVLISYLIGCESYQDAQTADLTRSYFEWIVSESGQEAAAESAGSAPISDSLRSEATAAIGQIKAS